MMNPPETRAMNKRADSFYFAKFVKEPDLTFFMKVTRILLQVSQSIQESRITLATGETLRTR